MDDKETWKKKMNESVSCKLKPKTMTLKHTTVILPNAEIESLKQQITKLTAERDKSTLQSDNPNEASAIEIFKKHGAHYYEDDENDIIAAMEEYKKQGRFYTEAEINEIQAAAYAAGMNTIN